jgi:hypothetical protein
MGFFPVSAGLTAAHYAAVDTCNILVATILKLLVWMPTAIGFGKN